MSQIHIFRFAVCRHGHMIYSSEGKPSRNNCETCGSEYLYKCDNCGETLPDAFRSKVSFSSGKPISSPKIPNHCRGCGSSFPWYIETGEELTVPFDFWEFLHPSVTGVAKGRFESGHYADSVEAALKALNLAVKGVFKNKTQRELDGVALMRQAFRPNDPVILLDDLSTETGRSIQQGYMDLYAGAIAGIRNPKAHDNLVIDEDRAIHHLFVTSLLFKKLEERL